VADDSRRRTRLAVRLVVDAERETAAVGGLNLSAAHTDFMVGGPEVEIDAKETTGAWIPLLRADEFQIA
jgi:leucyl aminopeptidase (aminopeptidase T)